MPNDLARRSESIGGIENSLHGILDVAFRENESRVRKNNEAEHMAMLRVYCVESLWVLFPALGAKKTDKQSSG